MTIKTRSQRIAETTAKAVFDDFHKTRCGPTSLEDYIEGYGTEEWWIAEGFEILSLIGSGGMAYVFKARHKKSGYILALKTFKVEGFEEEVMIHSLASTFVKGTIICYGSFYWCPQSPNYHYDLSPIENESLVMIVEYCPGGSLLSVLQTSRKQRLEEREATQKAKEIAVAIKELHSLTKIIHRDINCQNILVDGNGCCKIADFGISIVSSERDRRTTMAGTCPYIAPEMLVERNYSFEIDMWALGITCFIMVTGKHPLFPEWSLDESAMDVYINNNIDDDGSSLSFPEHVSTEAQDLIKGLLDTNPIERLTSQEVLDHKWIRKHCK